MERGYLEAYSEQLRGWVTASIEQWKENKDQLIQKLSFDEQQQCEAQLHDLLLKLNEVHAGLNERQDIPNEVIYRLDEQANRFHDKWKSLVTVSNQRVPIGGHSLPPLPYAYDALEPVISEEIMRLHHLSHHQSYVEGLNKAELKMQVARENNNFELIKHWQREAAFHGAGHYLHTIFWQVMSPEGGGRPSGPLARQIDQDFGSFEDFQQHFSEAAKGVEGVGWALLVWAPRAQRLEILQAEKHQNLSQWDVVPLLPLDVWEHAYYLQYQDDRDAYVDNWWQIVNWPYAQKRFDKASQLRWEPY